MVTNDGATILKNIGVDNPAAKVLVGESDVLLINILKQFYFHFYLVILCFSGLHPWHMVVPRLGVKLVL